MLESIYFILLTSCFFIFSLIFGVGINTLLLKIEYNEDYWLIDSFICLMQGITVIVMSYAIILTQFKTVLSLALIPLIYIWYANKRIKFSMDYHWSTLQKILPIIILLSSIIIGLSFMYHFGSNQTKAIHPDFIFYARLSHYIGEYKESIYIDSFNPQLVPYQPYHYFELWLNNLFAQLTGLNHLKLLLLVVYPVFFILSCLGVLSLCQFYKIKISIGVVLSSISILFVNGITYDLHNFIPYEIFKPCWEINYSLFFTFQKQSIIFVLLAFIYVYYQINSRYVLSVTSLVPIFYFTTYPVIYGIMIIISIYYFINKKRVGNIIEGCTLAISAIGIFLFYKLNNSNSTTTFNLERYISQFIDTINTILKADLHVIVQYTIIFFPLILLIILYKKINFIKLWAFIWLGIFFFGLLSYNLLFQFVDSNQLYSNILTPYTYLLMSVIFIHFFVKRKYIPMFILSIWIVFKTVSGLSHIIINNNNLPSNALSQLSFENKIKDLIKDSSNPTIGYISNPKNKDLQSVFQKNTYLTFPLNYIWGNVTNLSIINLSDFRQTNFKSAQEFEMSKHSIINHHILSESLLHKSEDFIISSFIKKYHINYLLIRPTDTFYSQIKSHISTKIRSQQSEFIFVELNEKYFI